MCYVVWCHVLRCHVVFCAKIAKNGSASKLAITQRMTMTTTVTTRTKMNKWRMMTNSR